MSTLKNIVISILMILASTACTSDMLEGSELDVDNEATIAADASLSINIASPGLTTKADSPTTENPIAKEAEINSCIVAVFECKSGNRIGYKYVSGTDIQSVDGIDCKEGAVDIRVIANMDDSMVKSIYTLKEFEAQTTSAPVAGLIKFGKATTTLEANKTDNEVTVQLTQLTARIDINSINVVPASVKGTFTFGKIEAQYNSVSKLFDPAIADNNINNQTAENLFSHYYTYTVQGTTFTVTGDLTLDGKTMSGKTFTVTLKDDLIYGNVYKLDININSRMELVTVDHTVVDWNEEAIDTILK